MPRADERDIAKALLLVATVWLLLLAGALLEGALGRGPALALAFGGAAALALRMRPPGRRANADALWRFSTGLLLGYASFPAWIVGIGLAGTALGMTPRPPAPPGGGTPLFWLASVALAPVFEEIAYRGRLLPALKHSIGFAPALLATSLAFAIPHAGAWPMLGTFLVGLYLGAARQLRGSLAVCIGTHAGLNLAGLLCGTPPTQYALSPSFSLVATIALLLLPNESLCREAKTKLSSERRRDHCSPS